MLIEVYADIACPWCYIGERRLAKALARRPDLDVERRWRPFQLQPDLPPGGLPWATFAERKFGSAGRARAAFSYVARAAQEDDLTFAFDRITKAPNTIDAHRLVLFAREAGRAWETAEALFAAYFTEGRDVTDLDTLTALAAEAGLDADRARGYLLTDLGRAEVDASQAHAGRLGIAGVPFFVFDGRYGLSGAQPVDVFVHTLDTVLAHEAAS